MALHFPVQKHWLCFFHAVHLAQREANSSLPAGRREPLCAVSILPVPGDKHSPDLGNLPKDLYLVFV